MDLVEFLPFSLIEEKFVMSLRGGFMEWIKLLFNNRFHLIHRRMFKSKNTFPPLATPSIVSLLQLGSVNRNHKAQKLPSDYIPCSGRLNARSNEWRS